MAIHRTALGKALDMSALASRNERVRAVGNMKVNARGDSIDGQGKVLVPVTKKVGDKYQRSVTNRAANVTNRTQSPVEVDAAPEEKFELTAEELEFEDTTEEDLEIELLKAAEAEIVIKPASEAPDFFEPTETKAKKTK
jgi:lipoate-protein ligase A